MERFSHKHPSHKHPAQQQSRGLIVDPQMCVLGECMLEVSAERLVGNNVAGGLSFGGDTLNTAVYYARMGGAVNYLSALGDDTLSAWMLDRWRAEGVGCDWVEQVPGAAPGLYLIQLDDQGERSFVYWRDNSPARALLQNAEKLGVLLNDATAQSSVLYLSGITLALMSSAAHRTLFEFARAFRRRGGLIAFDSNHRARLWDDSDTARQVYTQMYSHTDIALATAEDEYSLFGGQTTTDISERLQSWGVQEIVVKDGEAGCTLHAGGVTTQVPSLVVSVVDTTAAGDSFNAAYLFSRAAGVDALTSVNRGHALAGTVIKHRGAIIPQQAMTVIADLK